MKRLPPPQRSHQEQVLLEGRKMNLGDVHRSNSRVLTPVKLGRSLQAVTGAVIHQSLDGNQINKLSGDYIKRCMGLKRLLDIVPDEGRTHHISASKEMIGVCWQEF